MYNDIYKVECYDNKDDTINHLTQWDLGQIVYFKNLDLDVAPIVHIHNKMLNKNETVTVIPTLNEDKVLSVEIPNLLLQKAYPITIYLYQESIESGKTIYTTIIPVKSKAKPNDYRYVENITSMSLSIFKSDIEKIIQDFKSELDEYGGLSDEQISESLSNYLEKHPIGVGEDGKSAYQIALDNGFEGTEEEWIESLHGDDGYTPLRGTDYWTESDKQEIIDETKISIPLNEYVKSVNNTLPDANGNVTITVTAEQPEFVIKDTLEEALVWLNENGDTSKTYVLPDGYLYKYMTSTTTYDKPNCNNLFELEKSQVGYRISSNGSFKALDGRSITNVIPVTSGETYDIRFYDTGGSGVSQIVEFSDIPTFTVDQVPTNYISHTADLSKTWDEPNALTSKFTHTMSSTTKYIALDVFISDTTQLASAVITLNEPVVLGTTPTTIETTAWINTGHSYQATDYEDRIIAIEEDIQEYSNKLTALENGTISTIPTYWQEHLDVRVDNIRETMELAGRNKSAFLFYSDAHWDDGSKQAPILLNYLFKHTPINKTLFAGDIVNVEPTTETLSDRTIMEYLWDWRSQIRNLKHYSVIGNHDDGNATDNIFSSDYVYSFLFAPEEDNRGIVRGDADTYYYFDDAREKTRYLCLDTAYESVSSLSIEQTAFIKETLISTPENWHIVVVAHIWFVPDYDQYNVRPIPLTGLSNTATQIATILDNYNARVDDFIDCKAKVEFCIGGHIHRDYVDATNGGIPIILCETASLNIRGEFTCTLGTITETAISGIVADYDNDKVSVIRVGRGNSFEVVLSTGVKTVIT